jgi:hypothetical protein
VRIIRFCHWLEAHVNAAPSSTKYKGGTRDFEMHQTKKANQCHFKANAHIEIPGISPVATAG